MRLSRVSLSILLTLLFTLSGLETPAVAQSDAPVAMADRAEPLSDTLDNGLRIVVLEQHTAPVVTVQAWVNAGSTTEGDKLGAGLSHFLEHMLFKGTDRRSVGEMGRDVKAIGGYTNAYTSFDRTVFYIDCLADGVNEALDILTDVLNHATLDQEELERERTVIIKEMNLSRDDPAAWAGQLLFEQAFLQHPYRLPVIGYEDILATVTRDDLLSYYHALYVPNNITLVVVGDVDGAAVMAEARRLWEGVPRRSLRLPVRQAEPPQLAPREHIEERDAELAHVNIGFHGPSLSDPDLFAMDVLSLILGGGRTSRLYRSVREEQGLVHHIASFSYTPRDPGIFGVGFRCDPDKREQATAAVLTEIGGIADRGVSRRELETAKRKVVAQYYAGRETPDQLADSLGTGLLLAGDLHFDERYVAGVNGVTATDVKRVARRYLNPDNRTLVAVVPRGSLPLAAATAAESAAGSVQVHTLDNGIRIIIRENHTVPLVSLRGALLGGVRSETSDTAGITNLMTALLTKGTQHWTASELADVVESRGGSVGTFSGYNSWGANVELLSADLPLAVSVLQQVLVEPTFPEAAVSRERDVALANLQGEQEDPNTIASRILRRAMYPAHPYGWLPSGTPQAVRALTANDLRAYHRRVLDPAQMVISVIGDVRPDVAIANVSRAFGGLRAPEHPWQAPFPPQFPIQEGASVTEARQTAQTILMIAFPGVTVADERRTDLGILATALNGLGGRLFHRLRDEQGLAYTVGFWDMPGVDPGLLVFYIATVPDQREAALAGLWGEIDRLQEHGLTVEEIADAARVVRGDQARELETNASFGFTTALDELYGLGATYYQGLSARLKRVTPATTQEVARELFDRAHAVVVAVGPEVAPPN